MNDSDSEAFESADEDVEEKKGKTSESKIVPKPETNDQQIKKEEEPVAGRWGGGWGSSAFSMLSSTSKSIASITTQVSQSITTVIDQNFNIPDPEEMAKLHLEEKNTKASNSPDEPPKKMIERDESTSSKLDSLMSGVSQISNKVLAGGLDTLEGIGKKTINILQDTDPNLKSKIMGMNNKPNLSDILKEAKDKPEEAISPPVKVHRPANFDLLFDEFKGLVYFEALEILSNQSKMRIDLLLKPLSGKALTEMEETLEEVEELCEFPEVEGNDDDISLENLAGKFESAMEDLSVKVNYKEIISCLEESLNWISNEKDATSNEIFDATIKSLANNCALSLHNLHKLAELLLSTDHRSTANEADALAQLASIYCSLLNFTASQYSGKLTALDSSNDNKQLITNIFLECSQSLQYIRNAFALFIPILQFGAI